MMQVMLARVDRGGYSRLLGVLFLPLFLALVTRQNVRNVVVLERITTALFPSRRLLLTTRFYALKVGDVIGSSDYDAWIDPPAHKEGSYVPELGMESHYYTLGNLQPLTSLEYTLLFSQFPLLRNASIHNLWPTDRAIPFSEKESIQQAINAVESQSADKMYSEHDVDEELAKFRKTILSLEKYRINDPGAMAKKYNALLSKSLAVEGCWGGAANALEYAGLNFRSYINTTSNTATLALLPLWKDALSRLLDMEHQHTNRLGTTATTWDQKYFSQNSLTMDGILAVREMMIHIVRIAINICFSRNDIHSVDVVYPTDTSLFQIGEMRRFLPKSHSMNLIAYSDFSLIKSDQTVPLFSKSVLGKQMRQVASTSNRSSVEDIESLEPIDDEDVKVFRIGRKQHT